jgi:hypothetical protein
MRKTIHLAAWTELGHGEIGRTTRFGQFLDDEARRIFA